MSDAAADARDRMVVEAFTADIHRRAIEGKKGPVDVQELDRAIALRLRVTGRNRTELAAALGATRSVTDEASKARIRAAVNHAFSERSTHVIESREGWVARVSSLSSAVEMNFFRPLRSQTLNDLRHDLEAVWNNRALLADEARRRHGVRLAALHNIKWYTRRLKRCGLLVSILSTMVELTVLKPLLAHAKAAASVEQEVIVAAAQKLSLDLKRRRAEWIAFSPARARRPITKMAEPGASGLCETRLSASQVSGPTADASRSDAAKRAQWLDDEERRLVAQAALALMIVRRWNEDSARRLARLSARAEADLHNSALQLCTGMFGHAEVSALTAEQARQVTSACVSAARQHGWSDLTIMVVGGARGHRCNPTEVT